MQLVEVTQEMNALLKSELTLIRRDPPVGAGFSSGATGHVEWAVLGKRNDLGVQIEGPETGCASIAISKLNVLRQVGVEASAETAVHSKRFDRN